MGLTRFASAKVSKNINRTNISLWFLGKKLFFFPILRIINKFFVF